METRSGVIQFSNFSVYYRRISLGLIGGIRSRRFSFTHRRSKMFSDSWILEGYVWENLFIIALVAVAYFTGMGRKQS